MITISGRLFAYSLTSLLLTTFAGAGHSSPRLSHMEIGQEIVTHAEIKVPAGADSMRIYTRQEFDHCWFKVRGSVVDKVIAKGTIFTVAGEARSIQAHDTNDNDGTVSLCYGCVESVLPLKSSDENLLNPRIECSIEADEVNYLGLKEQASKRGLIFP